MDTVPPQKVDMRLLARFQLARLEGELSERGDLDGNFRCFRIIDTDLGRAVRACFHCVEVLDIQTTLDIGLVQRLPVSLERDAAINIGGFPNLLLAEG
jgi:hypothetical protein